MFKYDITAGGTYDRHSERRDDIDSDVDFYGFVDHVNVEEDWSDLEG